jgi:hypothetical protein
MTTFQLAILKYLFKYGRINFYCLTTDGKIYDDKNEKTEWAKPISANMWNQKKSLDDFVFSSHFRYFLHYFISDFTNEEIFNNLSYLLLNRFIEQDSKFITSYKINFLGESWCIQEITPISPISPISPIGFNNKIKEDNKTNEDYLMLKI